MKATTEIEALSSKVPVRFSLVCGSDYFLVSGFGHDGRIWFAPVPRSDIHWVFETKRTLKHFAMYFAISYTSARKVLEAHGIEFSQIIAEENRLGASLAELSRKHGPKPSTISAWIKKRGCDVVHGHSGFRDHDARIARIYERTGSVNACAQKLSISWATAEAALVRLGVRPKKNHRR